VAVGRGFILEDVAKAFGDLQVISHLSLTCRPGEFVGVLGPSGAGKTTLLRLIAGLDKLDSGRLVYCDESLAEVDASSLRIGMVFQEPRLLPWASLAANVRYGLSDRASRMSRSECDSAVAALLERVGLSEFASYLPHQVSGGMAQRASLARALIGDPDILLLDEPLGGLDIGNRFAVQDLLMETVIQRQERSAGIASVMVTHSIDEALYLCDRIYVLSNRPARVLAQVEVHAPRPRDRVNLGLTEERRQVIEALGVAMAEH
jgi:ABC-type nitrate/sulfonate/bicarbonate transport system ATPase subunit